MPAQIVKSQLIPEEGRDCLTIVDDFGTVYQLYLRVTEAAERRQQLIDAAIAQQSANETALKTYAETHEIDLTAQLAAGAAKRTDIQNG